MTNWTSEQYFNLSTDVANKFGIPASWHEDLGANYENPCGNNITVWIHDDWKTVMDLCVKHGVDAVHNKTQINACHEKSRNLIRVKFAHHYDKAIAERVARMLALMEVQL